MAHLGPSALAAVLVALASACGSVPAGPSSSSDRSVGRVSSNVLFQDYAGSDACSGCHGEIAARFARSPMHRMTRDAELAQAVAPFDGGTLRLADDVATMFQVDGHRYLRLDAVGRGQRLYRVTAIIGGRYREDYVGVRVAGVGARDRTLSDSPTQLVLPVSWVIGDREWRYKGYSVQIPERTSLRAGPVWNRTCILCHNAAPYLMSAYDELAGDRIGYQGSIPSNLLPPNRRLRFEVRDEAGLIGALAAEVERLGASEEPPEGASVNAWLQHTARVTGRRLERRHLVELGIGCESCHNGSREHVESPSTLPSYAPTTPLFSVAAEEGQLGRAGEINHVCARCHSVLFSRYPYTWEGGRRQQDPGGSTINSGEARNYQLGGCARAMTCTTCHDPHGEDDPSRLAWLATSAGNVTCTGCHTAYADTAALEAHAHHDPAGEGGACVGCHMPRKNAGLDYALTRYHRIGSPTDRERVERDRPLECALCHLDATVESTIEQMERWWGQRYDRDALRRLYGSDLSVSILGATLARGLPHEQTVAIERLGHTGDPSHADAIVEQLAHELPLVRYYARESLERHTGQSAPMDMSRPGEELRTAGRAWLEALRRPASPP